VYSDNGMGEDIDPYMFISLSQIHLIVLLGHNVK
jgi:hypothetical protein